MMMSTTTSRLREGMQHRFICSLPALLLLAAYLFEFNQNFSILNALSMLGAIVAIGLSFSAPLVLTKGWNKPFPSSEHLALCSRSTQKCLLVVFATLTIVPPLVRLLSGEA